MSIQILYLFADMKHRNRKLVRGPFSVEAHQSTQALCTPRLHLPKTTRVISIDQDADSTQIDISLGARSVTKRPRNHGASQFPYIRQPVSLRVLYIAIRKRAEQEEGRTRRGENNKRGEQQERRISNEKRIITMLHLNLPLNPTTRCSLPSSLTTSRYSQHIHILDI